MPLSGEKERRQEGRSIGKTDGKSCLTYQRTAIGQRTKRFHAKNV